jgi:hypothetical protein
MKLLKPFLETQNENRRKSSPPLSKLNDLFLQFFFLSVRNSDGSNYEPNTLRCKTNMLTNLMHQMRISITQVSSMMLRSKKLDIRKKNVKTERAVG